MSLKMRLKVRTFREGPLTTILVLSAALAQVMMFVARLASGLESLQGFRFEDTLKQFAAPLREQVGLG